MTEPTENPTEQPNSDGGTEAKGLTTLLDSSEGSKGQAGEQQQTGDQNADGGEQSPDAGQQTDDTPAPNAPEAYELKAPEGSEFGGEVLNVFAENVARELDLTQEQAQMVLDKMGPAVAQQVLESTNQRLVEQHDAWEQQTRDDPEFGGPKLDANLGKVRRGLQAYDKSGEFSELLKQTGLGSHKAVLKFIAAAGGEVGDDDELVVGAGGNRAPKRPADYLFGDM